MNISNLSPLHRRLIKDEGIRDRPYRCTEGKLTIGVGHNLDAEGLCKEAIFAQLEFDIAAKRKEAKDICEGFWGGLSVARQDVLICMVFQLGKTGVLGFPRMLAAIQAKRYAAAAVEMLNSRWAKQTPDRVKRLAKLMEKGEYERPFDEDG